MGIWYNLGVQHYEEVADAIKRLMKRKKSVKRQLVVLNCGHEIEQFIPLKVISKKNLNRKANPMGFSKGNEP